VLIVGSAVGALLGAARPPYRVGPWPGLTWHGAGVLVACAWMLLGLELVVVRTQRDGRAWPDLVVWAAAMVVPPVLATCVVRIPGAASAACGVYLLWRGLLSLVDPQVEPPPLLLPAAVAFDLLAWLRSADVRPPPWWRGAVRRNPKPGARGLAGRRVAIAGGALGLIFGVVEPPFAVLLGGDPADWSTTDTLLAAAVSAVVCAGVAAYLRRITTREAGVMTV
jgi:hypothetical protein